MVLAVAVPVAVVQVEAEGEAPIARAAVAAKAGAGMTGVATIAVEIEAVHSLHRKSIWKSSSPIACISTTQRIPSSAACATWIQEQRASCAASTTLCAAPAAPPEADRQHEFVMLRARLAYTIARHSLRSLDMLEKLLLQVTRKNDARGYERFRDLFEAIVAYNE